MGAPLNLVNKKFGRLYVVKQAPNRIMGNGDSRRAWLCECACGNSIIATTLDLRKGDVMSCGCLKQELDKERNKKHGMKGTHLYSVWLAMRKRCYNKNNRDYVHYGGRGICVCDEWNHDFVCFMEWSKSNGYADHLTIDRIDVNGNYEPGNCRWVTMKVQSNNRTNNRYIEHNGRTHTIREWSDVLGIPYHTLYMRLRNGWSIDKAFNKQQLN